MMTSVATRLSLSSKVDAFLKCTHNNLSTRFLFAFGHRLRFCDRLDAPDWSEQVMLAASF
jgi:hypothetical protein